MSGEFQKHQVAIPEPRVEDQAPMPSWSLLGSGVFGGNGIQTSSGTQGQVEPMADRRRHPRFKCEGTVEFRRDGTEASVTARLTDLSLSGCYVEMQATSAPGTALNMVLEVGGIRACTRGTVQVCYPLLGMGIAFMETAPAELAELERIVRSLAGGEELQPASPVAAEPRSSAPVLLMVVDAAAALNAITGFFGESRSLTREKFEELVRQSQERANRR
jgi:hypothetical protein